MAISPEAPKNTASRMLKVMLITIRKKYPEIIPAKYKTAFDILYNSTYVLLL
jgi:hypothetical protein